METFEWVPLANPQGRYRHQTFRARFGEGYTQAAGAGINSRYDEWPLTFQGSRTMIEDIQNFLDRHQGFRPFRWFPPLGTGAGLYDADEYTVSPGAGGCANYTLNVTFRLRMRMYAPTYSVPPVVSGLHQVGQVIAVSQGTWQSENPMQFEYQWLRNGQPIAGATGQNYTLVDDDLFNMISVRVTASSLGGSTSVETDPVLARLDSAVSWLYSDIAETIFVDTSGNTPATWGDPVGLIKDSSGNGNDFTQPTVTARPILRESETGIAYLDFDGTDDLISTELPAIENGTLVIAGTGGIWIDDDYNFAGGTFSIGTTSYPGGPEGILTAIGDPIVGGFLVINRQLTQLERDLVIQEMKERGAPGVWETGANFGATPSVIGSSWTDNMDGSYTYSSDTGAPSSLAFDDAGSSGIQYLYLARFSIPSVVKGSVRFTARSGEPPYELVASSATDYYRVVNTTATGERFNFTRNASVDSEFTVADIEFYRLTLNTGGAE